MNATHNALLQIPIRKRLVSELEVTELLEKQKRVVERYRPKQGFLKDEIQEKRDDEN